MLVTPCAPPVRNEARAIRDIAAALKLSRGGAPPSLGRARIRRIVAKPLFNVD
jgi:hypothetical protein